MINGVINLDEASLVVWNKALSLGMSYETFTAEFADHVIRTKAFQDDPGKAYVYVALEATLVYNIPAEIQVSFQAGTAKKITVTFDASATKIDSLSTGIKLYQEKVQQTARDIKAAVVKQFGNNDSKDYHFHCIKNGHELYSVIDDREWMYCSLILERKS